MKEISISWQYKGLHIYKGMPAGRGTLLPEKEYPRLGRGRAGRKLSPLTELHFAMSPLRAQKISPSDYWEQTMLKLHKYPEVLKYQLCWSSHCPSVHCASTHCGSGSVGELLPVLLSTALSNLPDTICVLQWINNPPGNYKESRKSFQPLLILILFLISIPLPERYCLIPAGHNT